MSGESGGFRCRQRSLASVVNAGSGSVHAGREGTFGKLDRIWILEFKRWVMDYVEQEWDNTHGWKLPLEDVTNILLDNTRLGDMVQFVLLFRNDDEIKRMVATVGDKVGQFLKASRKVPQ